MHIPYLSIRFANTYNGVADNKSDVIENTLLYLLLSLKYLFTQAKLNMHQ